MSRIEIGGIGIEYELFGKPGAPTIVLTPGGRFPKDTPGLREFAETLVAGGRRVLLWDRPNCGASDLCFDATSESELHGHTLMQLVRALELGPVTLAAGSAGSRVTLIAASRDPYAVRSLALWWISGGVIGLANLAAFYCSESATAAACGGMQAVAAAPCWAEQIERNPRGRDIILAQDPDTFIETMQRWAKFFLYSEVSPVPGMSPADFQRLLMPVLIFRNGKSDMAHTRRTSEWVHEMIPHSRLIEPPWPDQEWNIRSGPMRAEGRGLFENWPALAPELLAFTAED
jgi:pimeloyl-ACP methyl ester carboxylesterase